MPGAHTEKALEATLESGLLARGWQRGDPTTFDRDRALFPADVVGFIQATQTHAWTELKQHHGSALESAVLDALTKTLESHGMLEVLRHGFKFYGKKLQVASFRPAHTMNPDVLETYEQNRLTVTRQVKFRAGSNDSIDLVLALNGLPVATAELKNHFTGQNVQHAMRQYRDRNPRENLFVFKKRALVHFAVDPDWVYMTTKLDGEATSFLPFNRGNQGGAGNPEHPGGVRTAYLWEEVWERHSFLDILGRFLHILVEEKTKAGKKTTSEKMVFPRYHQLDAVRKLEAAARQEGPGHNYLIQHSAGSGKSNSIAWLAHHLAGLHDAKNDKVFDTIVVITDRRVLDKQLQDNIYQFEHKQGVVACIDDDSEQLAKALSAGTPIVVTTLQKFPFVTEKIGKLPKRKVAVIVDEAHSSQTGEAAREMKEVLAVKTLEEAEAVDAGEPDDVEDRIAQVMASRGRQKNLSFFAFTATPKYKTLQVFGHRDHEGKPAPFHLYSMRQAIDEGFILDVLQSYTTYRAYYRLVKATEDDKRVPKKEAARQLARFMSLHAHNIAQKTEVMVEHFRAKVRHKIGGKAKAMLVTSSRLHAVRYKRAFEAYIQEQGYTDIGVLVAFSGKVTDAETGLEYTEPSMNVGKNGKNIGERQLAAAFESDDYQVLLVANKYQTGFDQPLLHTMYVDKRLAGVQAVQTLSRLNRTYPGKEGTFILDFVNETEEIQKSFQPYYEQTAVAEAADPQQLYELSHRLDAAQVYWASELEAFCKLFFSHQGKMTGNIITELYRWVEPGKDRFIALAEEQQDAFRDALTAYLRLYAFMSQVMPYQDADLEKLFTFGRFLELKLPHDPKKTPLTLDGEVALQYYRLEKIEEAQIKLRVADSVQLKGPTDVGTRAAKDEVANLSEIITIMNERFGTEFTKADGLLFHQFVEEAKQDEEVVQRAKANALDNFALSMKGKIEAKMLDRMEQNQDVVSRYMRDPQFQDVLFRWIVRQIYEDVREVG